MNKPWQVYFAAATGLTVPDFLRLVENFNPFLDALVRAGQVGVAIVTVLYIYKKTKNLPTRRRKKK